MSYTVTLGSGATKQSSIVITSIVGGAGFGLIRGGALTAFLANGVVPGDRITLTGTTSNNGTYTVQHVIDARDLVVNSSLTNETPPGTSRLEVKAGTHTLEINNEATTSWAAIFAAVANRGLVDEFKTEANTQQKTVYLHCFDKVKVTHSGATATAWASEDEIVVCLQKGLTSRGWELEFLSSDPGTFALTIGDLDNSADRRSYRKTSYWPSVRLPSSDTTKFTLNVYGSAVSSGHVDDRISIGQDGQFFGALLEGAVKVPVVSDAGAEFQDVLNTSHDDALVIGSTVDFSDNYVQARSESTAQSNGNAVLSGFKFGEDTVRPLFSVGEAPSSLELRNLEQRIDEEDDTPWPNFFGLSGGAGDGDTSEFAASFGWRPRFVERRNPVNGSEYTLAINGAQVAVELYDVDRVAFITSWETIALPEIVPAGDYSVTIFDRLNDFTGTTFTFTANGTDHDRADVAAGLIAAIGARATMDVVTYTEGALLRGLMFRPTGADYGDGPIVDEPFGLTFAAPADPDAQWQVRDHITAVSGSPFTTVEGFIGDFADGSDTKYLPMVYLKHFENDDNFPFRRRLKFTFTHEQFQTFTMVRRVDRPLREDITVPPFNPLRQNP